jgi:hypothetical protein
MAVPNRFKGHNVFFDRKPQITPAYTMRKMPNSYLREHVSSVLGMLEATIRAAVDSKVMSITTELGTMYDVPGMPHQQAQNNVFYHVLTNLEAAGYIAKLQPSPNGKVFITVRWQDDADIEVNEYMNNYIKERIEMPNVSRRRTNS